MTSRTFPARSGLVLLGLALCALFIAASTSASEPWSGDPCMAQAPDGLGQITDPGCAMPGVGGLGCQAGSECRLCAPKGSGDRTYMGCADLWSLLHEPYTFRVYRAIDSSVLDGDLGSAGKSLENTNTASAGGVLGYLHSEVVPNAANPIVPGQTPSRHNGIDSVAVFEVRMLNVRQAQLLPRSDPKDEIHRFGPFMAFDAGQATPGDARKKVTDYGAFVGIQDQSGNSRHAYAGDWQSFVGYCPLTEWIGRYEGRRQKPKPCPTTPSFDDLCGAGSTPDASPSCQYTYRYLGRVDLDALVGITASGAKLCDGGSRACTDYADFRTHGAGGGVEYSPGPTPDSAMRADCAGAKSACRGAADAAACCATARDGELGLPFWRNRCDPVCANLRIQALTKARIVR